jgi:prevent-host-death family protein
MTDYVNIYDIRTHFSEFIRRAEGGETIVIARNNLPVAELRPVKPDAVEVSEGFRALRERLRLFNEGKPVLAPGETWRDLIHEEHPY